MLVCRSSQKPKILKSDHCKKKVSKHCRGFALISFFVKIIVLLNKIACRIRENIVIQTAKIIIFADIDTIVFPLIIQLPLYRLVKLLHFLTKIVTKDG